MKKIVWDAEFSVGVKKMDAQHQRIIRIFNKLVDNAQADSSSEAVSGLLTEMVEYASEHFKSEEKLLEEYEHPDLVRQKASHLEFRRKVGEFCVSASKNEKVTRDLLIYLHDWWKGHILYEDKKYAAFFRETLVEPISSPASVKFVASCIGTQGS